MDKLTCLLAMMRSHFRISEELGEQTLTEALPKADTVNVLTWIISLYVTHPSRWMLVLSSATWLHINGEAA